MVLLGRTRHQPDTRHVFPIAPCAPIGAVRLDAFPDGGLSRASIIGRVAPEARSRAGYRWFNSLPRGQAMQCLAAIGMAADGAEEVIARRNRTGSPSIAALAALLEGAITRTG